MNDKIVEANDIETVRKMLKKQVVLVGGCFDLLHYGHFSFLKAAKEAGDTLVVALESDEFIKKKKERTPVHTQKQRAEILAGLEMVDLVVLLPLLKGDEDYGQLVRSIYPDIIAVTEGDPYIHKKQLHANAAAAKISIVSPVVHTFSTSSIIEYANLLRD